MTRSLSRPARRGNVAALLCVALVFGACSNDDPAVTADDPAPADDEATAASPDEEPAEPVPDEPEEEESDGAPATVEPPLDLAGTSWVPANFMYQPGDTGITNPIGDDVFFEFGSDGAFFGFTGCNEFEGTWEIIGPYYDYDEAAEAFEDQHDGQPVMITAEPTTAVECEGFLADDDVNLLGALTAVEIWWIGNDLGDREGGMILDGEGARIWADPA